MGLFGGKKKRKRPAAKAVAVPKSVAVWVSFSAVAGGDISRPGSTYVYEWVPTRRAPVSVGLCVVVDGGSVAVVTAVGTAADATRARRQFGDLSPLLRPATLREVQKAGGFAQRIPVRSERELFEAQVAWLGMMRRAAGLEVTGVVPAVPPIGFVVPPPADGSATSDQADKFGRTWYRAWKLSETLKGPAEERDAFKSISYRWFAIRDRD